MPASHLRNLAIAAAFLFCIPVYSPATAQGPVTPVNKKNIPQRIAIRNVNVLPMTSRGALLKNVTILIDSHKVVSIGVDVPQNVKVIDGTNKWLIPGLIDMHVHIPADIRFGPAMPTKGADVFFDTQDNMTPYIANGVTTVFELNAQPAHVGQRNQIAKGDVIGPRIALAALIDGGRDKVGW